MTTDAYSDRNIVSHEEWLAARKAHYARERAVTHELDRLREERRALPWERVARDYRFATAGGERGLADLFGPNRQLAIYHFMLAPGDHHQCPGCSLVADHIDCARRHFEHADLSVAVVSRAPVDEIEAVRQRMGWTFPWLSDASSAFSHDFGVYFTPEERAAGEAEYNFGTETIRNSPDMFGLSVFVKADDGTICHSYSTYRRGVELLMGALNWLDLTPRGRAEEDGTHAWLKVHDQYGAP